MNIAILHYHRIGGSGVVAYEIGLAMARRGHQIHFVGLEPPFRLLESENESMNFHKIFVKEYPVFDFQPYTLALASQLSEIIDRHAIDIVHSHYALPHAIGAILAKDISGKDVRCVTTLHGTDITVVGAHPTMKNITRYAIEKSDHVTAVSDYLTRTTEEVFRVPASKIRTIYNFVNPENFNPQVPPHRLCQKKGKREVLIHVSNLREVKSPIEVINIFAGIVKSGVGDYELWVVGEGPLEQDMIERAERFDLLSRIKFLGVRAHIAPLLVGAQLMLLPSKYESFGLSALEAMACGVPVLASRSGGLPEVIEDGTDGLLFSPGDTEEAVSRAVALLSDRVQHQEMKKQSAVAALKKFSPEKIIDQYESIYGT